MFRVVTPPIIRSTYNCNYSTWHWSNRLCYLPLSWRSWSSNSTMTAEGSRDGLTSARCYNYSYKCSWWWVELPLETYWAVYRNIINCIQSHLVGQLLTPFPNVMKFAVYLGNSLNAFTSIRDSCSCLKTRHYTIIQLWLLNYCTVFMNNKLCRTAIKSLVI